MLTVFLVLAFVWVAVTVLGHGSWLLFSACLRAIFSTDQVKPSPPQPVQDDVAASHRVITRLSRALLISPEQARKWRGQLEHLEATEQARLAPREVTPRSAPSRENPAAREPGTFNTPTTTTPSTAFQSHRARENSGRVKSSSPSQPVSTKSPVQPVSAPQPQPPASDVKQKQRVAVATVEASSPTLSAPRQAAGRTLAEFLADHNIRWGELIAGLLIVVCSIGLVISLWETLTRTHRAVPSLLFLAGNAAIFGAGLYTLFRWRLRDTSRAMLMIATLLVPLGILAGLSIGGTGASTVQLTDPVTLIALLVAGAVYVTLIWQASRALVGTRNGLAMTIGVAGPAATLPLMPAAIRAWQGSAGNLVVLGSIAAWLSTAWLMRAARNRKRIDGGRRLMILGVSSFSMATLVAYAGYMLRDFESAWLSIAIVSIPGVVAMASIASSLAGDSRRSDLSSAGATNSKRPVATAVPVIGSVLFAIGMMASSVVIIPAMMSMGWLWAWGLSLGISAAFAAIVFGNARWSVAASVPIGLATVLSSVTWNQPLAWSEIPFWTRLVGGHPMVASLAVAAATLGLAIGLRKTRHGKPLLWTAAAWAALGIANAAILTVAPASLLGSLPTWTLPVMLGSAMVAITTLLYRQEILSQERSTVLASIAGGISLVCLAFWVSIFKPIVLGETLPGLHFTTLTIFATGITLSVIAEIWAKRGELASITRTVASMILMLASGTALLLTLPIHESELASFWLDRTSLALVVLATCVVAWNWIGLVEKNAVHLVVARVFAIFTAIVVGHVYFGDHLTAGAAWRSGMAIWSWAAWCLVLVACIQFRLWLLAQLKRSWETLTDASAVTSSHVTQLNDHPQTSLASSRIGQGVLWYAPGQQVWDGGSGMLFGLSAVALSSLFAIGVFALLLLKTGTETSLAIDTSLTLPLLVLGVIGAWIHQRRIGWSNKDSELSEDLNSDSLWTSLECVHFAAVIGWGAWQLAIRTVSGTSQQLILATSVIAALCFAIDLIRHSRRTRAGQGLLTGVGLIVVGLASGCLLTAEWFPAILESVAPDRWTTFSVATWWIIAAATSLGIGWRSANKVLCILAAIFIPATVLIVSPIWVPAQWWIWIQASAISSGVLAASLAKSRSAFRTDPSAPWTIDFAVAEFVKNFVQKRRATKVLTTSATETFAPAIDGSMLLCLAIGLASAIGVIAQVLLERSAWLHTTTGCFLAGTVLVLLVTWNRMASQRVAMDWPVSWPTASLILSGHGALLVGAANWLPLANGLTDVQILLSWWTATAAGLAAWNGYQFWKTDEIQRAGQWWATSLVVVVSTLTLLGGNVRTDFTIGLIAVAIGGMIATVRAALFASKGVSADRTRSPSASVFFTTRVLCWFVFVIGGLLITRLSSTNLAASDSVIWTMLLAWVGGWTLVWRMVTPDSNRPRSEWSIERSAAVMLADVEGAVIVLIAALVEFAVVWSDPFSSIGGARFADPMVLIRLSVMGLVAVSVVPRIQRRGMLEVSAATLIVLTTLASWRIANQSMANPATMLAVLCLVPSAVISAFVFSASQVCWAVNVIARKWSDKSAVEQSADSLSVKRYAESIVRVGVLVVVVVVTIAGWMLVTANNASALPVAICGVAMLAVAAAETALRTRWNWLRYGAMGLGLTAIGMWASVKVAGQAIPGVTLSIRWFVGWIIVAGAITFVVPKIVSARSLVRWRRPLRAALIWSLALAFGSLAATLCQELMIRSAGQTELIAKPLVLGMAAALAVLSLMSTVAAICSGPGFAYRDAWQFTDPQRRALVVAAQVFGGLTWFHLFLCKNPLASLGLRAYWPYVVMTLSFASVGITHWAIRRGDEVLSSTLRKTALFLPLVPVIGFWLSSSWITSLFGSSSDSGWTFIQGRVTYEALLVVAALYYAAISFLWKSGRTRIASIILGNVALWVVLTQMPDWGFLAHPQAWLIPPAVCVLIATHLHRKTLDAKLATSIRYAATLTIYITSTADMLLQGIGSTLAGPIVLITLALIGAGLGVALRIRPFLYLGAVFVFVGVTSMVWHAQQQIDAVWPWWAFGISTGLLLLVALTMIEKNKPKLKRIAGAMQQWDA